MKKIFTLCALALLATTLKAQVVFNEIYADPGGPNHEFFEFYNTSSSPIPESMDNYTIVAYYEQGSNTGFYVMDLPAMFVGPKGYFVGASANPFNVQGQSNLVPDFNWNAMPVGGSLTKWQRNGGGYTQVAPPVNLNDFFVRVTGSGSSQHILIYKNGILVNGLIAGTNFSVVPAKLKVMPDLPIDMSGTSPDFVASFSTIQNNQLEYSNSAPGSDNGYIRLLDGKCGVWNKSSAAVNHTPGKSNGSATGVTGDLSISYSITEMTTDINKALLTYNITAQSLGAFPVTVEIYQDKGIIGQLDASDVLVDTRVLTTLTEGDQFVTLPTRNDPVMLVAISPSGCFDQVIAVPNNLSTLPVHLVNFSGSLDKNNKVTLNWTVADNETASYFEIERSANGRDFTTVAMVFASEKMGTEIYKFFETINTSEKVMYRLRMTDKGHDVNYSKILVFQSKSSGNTDIKIIGNPVYDKLTFSFNTSSPKVISMKVYEISGRILMIQKHNSLEGNNLVSLSLNNTFKPGLYILELNDGNEIKTAKFIKQ